MDVLPSQVADSSPPVTEVTPHNKKNGFHGRVHKMRLSLMLQLWAGTHGIAEWSLLSPSQCKLQVAWLDMNGLSL